MAAATEGPGEASSEGETSGKVNAKKAKADGKGRKGKEKKSDSGGKAGGAGASGLRKGLCVSAAAAAGSPTKGKRERGRKSVDNCVEWACVELDRWPRSTTARPCGMLAVCLLVCVCCGLTYSWRCRRELRTQQGRERVCSLSSHRDGRVEVC